MKCKKKTFSLYIRHMRLTDKFLCIYLFLLLLQMTHTLFQSSTSQIYDSIDVMMRTTAATIFGYFISATFEKTNQKDENISQENKESTSDISVSERNDSVAQDSPFDADGRNCRIHQQILIVAGIGILSFVILVLIRNFGIILSDSPASISQMQDFIVGSIGFLIGHAKYEQN